MIFGGNPLADFGGDFRGNFGGDFESNFCGRLWMAIFWAFSGAILAPREPHLRTLSGPLSSAFLAGSVIKLSNFSTEPKTRFVKMSLFALEKTNNSK